MLIININGVDFKPSVMEIGIQDVSAADAGRTQQGVMQKMRIAEKTTINLEWWEPSRALTSQILWAVHPEYFNVTYYDPKTMAVVTKVMYVGDRTAPVRMWGDDRAFYSRVSFNLIER